MNIHEIFDLYKDKRETILEVHRDLQEQCNEIRAQRDFAMTLLKFIDMKSAIDSPTGTYEEVIRLMFEKDRQNYEAFEALKENQRLVSEHNIKQREEGGDHYIL